MRLQFLALLAILALPSLCRADDKWDAYRFLIGDWKGGGGGQPGQAAGSFSFATELQGAVLVRRARAVVKTPDGRTAVHEDLMVVHEGQKGQPAKASYFDSEGHVIEYRATLSADGKTLAFVSDAAPSAPRYRLTYAQTGENTVTVKFEVAPPGKPEGFRTYVEGTAEKIVVHAGDPKSK